MQKHTIVLITQILFLKTYATKLEVVNQWNFLEFDPPNEFGAANFRPENTVFTGVEITPDRIFISIPRLRDGVPATLVTVPRNTPPGSSPKPQPYPDWSYHGAGIGLDNATTCAGLVSVYRTRLDSCGRLWVLDSGLGNSLDDFRRICNPKLVVFNLKTDQPERIIELPREAVRPATVLANLVIDESVQGSCDSAFIYMADTVSPALVVHDALRNKTWRVSHPTMYPEPSFATYHVNGETFTLPDGVVGLAHSPNLATLFYQPLATDKIYTISTKTLTKGPPGEFEDIPIAVAGTKSSQGLGLALDQNTDTLFFVPLAETSLAAWNPRTNFHDALAYDPTLLDFASELRWKEDGLWILSSRFQKFYKRTVTANEINLRVLRLPLNPHPAQMNFEYIR
ncbi:unnamed protein product [Ceutorhynchus assimilis]|uniref:Yellow-e n=1 Tax=Ceutorhynchus assimilis TaxID=467358 RepID=A0A9N9N0B0_9CUCU|nr:unnamed protein product [Ceutorhynchus assimilis]